MISQQNEHPPEAWKQTTREIRAILEVHPLLQPLRNAREMLRVGATPRGIWAAVGELVVQTERPDWWEARTETPEDRVQNLARCLAIELRRAWDGRQTARPR